MTISYNRTRNQIATLVMGKLGVRAAGGAEVSADSDLVYEALDLRLKEIHRLGIFWRKVDPIPYTFSLSAGSNSASATADILFPIKMTVTNGSLDEPVDIISKRQYTALTNKTQAGTPTKALWHGNAIFTFFPVPSVSGTAKVLYEKYADDTSAGAAVDVDVAMLRSLCNIVAYDVADMFGIDEAKITRWQKEALVAERYIRALAVERVDYTPVKVDDWGGPDGRVPTDYDRYW